MGKSNVERLTLASLLIAVGIVFGDIGTSPLYVMKAVVNANPAFDDAYIIGAVSCIIWTLTLQTTVKYVFIALRADNHGEGGILALYALMRKLRPHWLYILAAVGASALIADGVITPAMTVTSAVEGLHALDSRAPVLPLVLLIITAIFFVQKFGTKAIGRGFGPFMAAWFLMLGVMGAMHLGSCPAVLKAFNPWYAVRLLVHSPSWFLIMGAVFLCTTGAEALYSDLGHCGRRNITVSWIFVKTMLIVNYLGQAAWIITHRHEALGGNPFYGMMPVTMLPYVVALATGAAIIASQALLSGSFTIFSEAANLNLWPRLRIDYPTTVRGQLYIPSVNWCIFAGCVATVLMFRTSSRMEAAYGLAITVTMLMTTVLLAIHLRHRGVPKWLIVTFAAVFVMIEGTFFVANMFKFMHGGWFTALLAGTVCLVMTTWYRARKLRDGFIEYESVGESLPLIESISRDREIPKYASNLVYISKSESADTVESKLLYSIVRKYPKRADHYWLLRIVTVDEPDTLEYRCHTLIPRCMFSVEMRVGFRIHPRVSVYLRQVIEDLEKSGEVDLTSSYPSLRQYGVPGDFRFIRIHRIFSASSHCSHSVALLMYMYDKLRRLGVSDEKAFGLDTSVVTVENVPLIINNRIPSRIIRVG